MREGKRLALVGGTVIDGRGGTPVRDGVVVVSGKRIESVGRREELPPLTDCEVVDVAGQTVMPGMIDTHTHVSVTTMSIEKRLFTPRTVVLFQAAGILKRMLHAGFTTIREPGSINDVGLREAVELGLIEGSRVVMAGGIGQTGGHFDEYYPVGLEVKFFGAKMVDGVPAVQKAARQVLREGFDFIKVCTTGGVASPADSPEYVEWTLDELKAIVYEAGARGRAVMAHAEGTQGIKNAVIAGVWSVEHGSMLDDEAIDLFLERGTYLVPTLFVFEETMSRAEEIGLSPVAVAKLEKVKDHHLVSFQRAAQAGVKMAVGTDAIDDSMHGKNARELEIMVRLGYSPMQAIQAATKVAAEVCRIDDKTGTLEAGKLADLLVVEGDPLADIAILCDQSRLSVVMKEGTRYVNRL